MGDKGVYNYDPITENIVLRSRIDGSVLTDYGYQFPEGTVSQSLLETAPDGSLILCPGNLFGGTRPMYRVRPGIDAAVTEVFRITSDLQSSVLHVGNAVYRIRFDTSGRLFLFTRINSTTIGVIRLNADLTLDTTFTLSFALSTDILADNSPDQSPAVPVQAPQGATAGVDMSADGRYLYACATKGTTNTTGALLYRNIYRFDLDAVGGPTAVLWKQIPYYEKTVVSYSGNGNSPGHNFLGAPQVLAVDPVTGNVAVVIVTRSSTTFHYSVSNTDWEVDNYEDRLHIYDPSGTELSSLLLGVSEEQVNPATGTPTSVYAGYYFADITSNPMRWTADGSNVYFWMGWNTFTGNPRPSGLYFATKDGIVSAELYTGNIRQTTALISAGAERRGFRSSAALIT